MWLRLLIPLALLWPVLAVAAEGTSLRRYRAGAARELPALGLCVILFFLLWLGLDRLLEGVTGSVAAGLVLATLLSLSALPLLLLLGFRAFGVRPSGEGEAH